MIRLGAEPDLDADVLAMTPDERVAMVWQLTLDAWAVAGREIPRYARHAMPGRMVRGGC